MPGLLIRPDGFCSTRSDNGVRRQEITEKFDPVQVADEIGRANDAIRLFPFLCSFAHAKAARSVERS
jgi:hypothetical protein